MISVENYREKFPFGEGRFVGPVLKDPTFFRFSTEEQARILGWANGCPPTQELIDPHNTAPGRGPENMLKRYGEVNFWFGQIVREVAPVNPRLAKELRRPSLRFDDEPVGKYEPTSVPASHFAVMAPVGALAGFALPRLFAEQLHPSKPKTDSTVASRMSKGLAIVQAAAKDSDEPLIFMATVAEGLAEADADPLQVLKLVLGREWLEEQNAKTMLGWGKIALQISAPKLWGLYSSMTPEQRTDNRLA